MNGEEICNDYKKLVDLWQVFVTSCRDRGMREPFYVTFEFSEKYEKVKGYRPLLTTARVTREKYKGFAIENDVFKYIGEIEDLYHIRKLLETMPDINLWPQDSCLTERANRYLAWRVV